MISYIIEKWSLNSYSTLTSNYIDNAFLLCRFDAISELGMLYRNEGKSV